MATTHVSADIVIVGGGITGLSAAHGIVASQPEASVVLLEGADRLGGKIATVDVDGLVLESGADSFLTRDPVAASLCDELGLRDDLVEPAVFGAVVADTNGLHPLPGGFVYGLPTSVGAIMSAESLSFKGKLRACADLVLPGRLRDDMAVGAFVRRRFGTEVLDRIVDPLLAGTRAGLVDNMSLAAAMPQIFEVARDSRSVILGLGSASRRSSIGAPPPFVSIRGGLSRLVDALRDRLDRVEIRTGTRAIALSQGSGYTVETTAGTIESSAVILTIPTYEAAPLLSRISPPASTALAGIEYASAASIVLVYDDLSFSPPDGTSGLLVAGPAQRVVAGCTWYSKKWPAASDRRAILRCFVGRAGVEPNLEKDDDSLVNSVVADVQRLLKIRDVPSITHVTRWKRGLPQYAVGHLNVIDYAERALVRDAPGTFVAGAGLRGSGIPDCIKQGRCAAAAALSAMATPSPRDAVARPAT